jgi:hypothetical protein
MACINCLRLAKLAEHFSVAECVASWDSMVAVTKQFEN